MATEQTIEIADDGVVTVDLPDDEASLGAEQGNGAAAEPAKGKEPTNAADEAAAVLNQAIKTAEDRRIAAEATADSERRARQNAERLAADREIEARTAREQVQGHEITILNSGIESAKGELSAAQQELERALEAGEFSKVGTAQVRIAGAAARIDRLEAEKVTLQARKPSAHEGRVETPAVVSVFENYVSQFTPRSQAWLRAHPGHVPAEAGGDPVKNATMMSAHYQALAKGIKAESDDYFRFLEENIGERTAAAAAPGPVSAAAEVRAAGAEPVAARPAARPAAPRPSAPVSREPPTANGSSPRRISLTADQQEVALFSYPANPGESDDAHRKRAFGTYAKEFFKAKDEGKIGRLSH